MDRFFTKDSALLALTALLMIGCADISPEALGDEGDEKLLRGQVTSVRPEIGRLSLNGSLCTATLIRPRVVISAAHCVGYRTRSGAWGDFVVERSGRAHRHRIDAVYSFGDRLGEKDITLIHLADPVPNSLATPAKISTLPSTTCWAARAWMCRARASQAHARIWVPTNTFPKI